MTTFEIVWLYGALYLLMLVYLIFGVIRIRFGNKISIGDGGRDDLAKRIRAHGNFVETTPFMMLALIGLAMLNASPIIIHLFGAVFLIGRILHAVGMVGSAVNKPRQIGMLLTLLCFTLVALYILFLVFI